MKTKLLAVALLAGTMAAALPGPDPIITVDGAAKAAKLSSELRALLAPRIEALNAAFQELSAAQGRSEQETPAQLPHRHGTAPSGPRPHVSVDGMIEECMRLYHEIGQQLDPAQQEAFAAYLHAQLKVAGFDPATVHHTLHPVPGYFSHGAGVPDGA
ncbi:MAG: hypothetical protein FIB01_05550 [Gemmatimonadetes bacterium]|nr:hypothetical protein [Gemmatimonadota bacterium]